MIVKKYKAPFSRKKTSYNKMLSFATVNNIDVDFGPRPRSGDNLKQWQEKVLKSSKSIHGLIMKTAYRGKLLSDKDTRNYLRGNKISGTKYQQIVSDVFKKYGSTNVLASKSIV